MADVVEDVAPVADVEKQDEATTDVEKVATNGAAKEEVKVEAEIPQEANADETKDTVHDSKEDDNIDTKSPDNKRKEAPTSLSAHDRNDRKRARGGYQQKSNHRNIASRFDDQEESNDPDEIRRQVEFYFSDSNLPIDAYLLSATGGHRNRPVELKVIHNFKRMRHFQPFSAVRDAVKGSEFLDLNDDDEITRKVPLDEKFTDDPMHNRTLVHTKSMPRSIYAKGFGEETKSTHLDIEAFFAPYGPISSVRLRRQDDGAFKGSVFVEFQTEDSARAFLELDPKPQWNDKDLEIMSKQEYVDIKHQGIMDGVVKPRSPGDFGSNRGKWRGKDDRRGGGGGRREDDRDRRRHNDGRDRDRRGSKDKFDRDDWKTRRERDQEDDRRGGFRNRGRGDRGGRGNRDSRGGRRRSPDGIDRIHDERIKAEAVEVKTEEDARENGGDADGGAEETKKAAEVKENGDAAEAAAEDTVGKIIESKKRALEEDGEEHGEAKKVKGKEDS